MEQFEHLGPQHPVNNEHLSTLVEIDVDPSNGDLAHIAMPKSSGVNLFDSAVLESFLVALPVHVPAALSTRNTPILLRWELHRQPAYACSAYFAKYLKP